MFKRFGFPLHVAFTLIAFATTGRPPRFVPIGPRDLAVYEERLTTRADETLA